MTAFGPYQTKEVIDFTKLHEHGIFVVSGATGAGKTTIFDAITFALYDSGSGEDREKSLFYVVILPMRRLILKLSLNLKCADVYIGFGENLVIMGRVRNGSFLKLRVA